jgi:hypothetical protein
VDEANSEISELLSTLSGKNGWQGWARAALDGVFPGLGDLVPESDARLQTISQEMSAKAQAQLQAMLQNVVVKNGGNAAVQDKLNNQLASIMQRYTQQAGNNAANSIGSSNSNTPQWTNAEFRRLLQRNAEDTAFRNMFEEGRAGDIGQELGRKAEEKVKKTRDKWKRIK